MAPAPAAQPSPPPPPERPAGLVLACDGGERLSVRTFPDEVHVAGLGPQVEVLLRDAGGLTPLQAVYSNPRWRAWFGLGADARQVEFQQVDPGSRTLRCRRP